MADQYWIESETVSDLLEYLHLNHSGTVDRERSQDKFHLTSREMEVVAMVIAGCSNKEIADKLSLSQNTVKHRLSSICAKLGVSDRLQLALFAIRHRLVDDQMHARTSSPFPATVTRDALT
jgi:DNA-binding NarL/FixJ family response regulator